jgi:S1-C subfamily serine protease
MFSHALQSIVGAITSLALSVGLISADPATNTPIQTQSPKNEVATSTSVKNHIEAANSKSVIASTTSKMAKKPAIVKKTVTLPKKQTAATQIPSSFPTTTPVTPVKKPISTPFFDTINQNARVSLVNIFCRNTEGMSITGTGTVISPQGVVLTNAHLGQYFALEHTKPEQVICWIRTGSPAREAYKASLLYISTKWVTQNTGNQTSEDPSGTGERDFALLLLATSTKSTALSGEIVQKPTPQQSFPPALAYEDAATPQHQDTVLVAGYSAGFLGASEIERNLYTSSSITTIEDIYTYESEKRPIDLIMLKGSISAQKGTSGGAVVNTEGKLIGIVSIVTKGKTTNERLLGAITLPHITQSFFEETGFTFTEYISGNYETLAKRAEKFNEFSARISTILSTKPTKTATSTHQ